MELTFVPECPTVPAASWDRWARKGLSDGWHNRKVPRERDVQAFHDRADTYEDGWRGRMHHDIAARTADLALTFSDAPRRGCSMSAAEPDSSCGSSPPGYRKRKGCSESMPLPG